MTTSNKTTAKSTAKTGRKAKSATKRVASGDTLDDFLGDIPDDRTPLDRIEPEIRSSRYNIALHALNEALTPKDRLRMLRFGGAGVVIQVPSADWVPAMRMAAQTLVRFNHTVCRTGSARTTDRPDNGNHEIGDFLGAGGRVLGISQNPEQFLPSALVTAADIRIRIDTPSNAVIRKAILSLTGRKAGRMPPDIARGLSFDVLAASLRKGTLPSACVRRLIAASQANATIDPTLADVPLLKDVHGYGRAGEYARTLAEEFSEWKAGRREWSSLEVSCLLAGNPGTGKTTLVRSIAKTLSIPIINTSVAAWFSSTNGYLNEIIKEIDRIFLNASQMSPVVLFVDECDAIPSRSGLGNRNRDYWMPLINHCLTTFEAAISGSRGKIILIGATNYPELIDPALLRPGRLGRVITIEPPDAAGLAGILRQHLGPKVLDGVDLTVPATLGVGATGAQATAWVAGAERRARDAGRPMKVDDLIRQIVPPDPRSQAEILACSYHEAAHAVAVQLLGVGEVVSLSNVAIAGQGGLTKTKIGQTTTLSRAATDAYVVSILAGRAGDEVFTEVNSGSGGAYASDLDMATAMLATVHCSLGLGGSLIHRASETEAREVLRHDPEMRKRVESDLTRLYKVAVAFVETHRDTIEILARRLVEARIMPGDEIRRLIGRAGSRHDILATLGGHDA